MKKSISILAIAAFVLIFQPFCLAKPKTMKTVVFDVPTMHCANCMKKMQENISFEKGVKDLALDLEAKTATVTFNAAKTDAETLAAAMEKLGFKPAAAKELPESGKAGGDAAGPAHKK